MTEITQADRDAAASGYFAWCGGNPVIPDRMKAGNADDHSMVQAFARHRMEERAAVVTWLRDDADQVVNADSPVYGADIIAEAIVECAIAIEAGEHLK